MCGRVVICNLLPAAGSSTAGAHSDQHGSALVHTLPTCPLAQGHVTTSPISHASILPSCTGCIAAPGYTFIPGKDSTGSNIGFVPGTVPAIAAQCSGLARCAGFNTNGW